MTPLDALGPPTVVPGPDTDTPDPPTDDDGRWLDVDTAARVLEVDPRTVRRRIGAGHVRVRGPRGRREVWIRTDEMVRDPDSLDDQDAPDSSTDDATDTPDAGAVAVRELARALAAATVARDTAEQRAMDAERRAADALAEAARYRERSDWLAGQVAQLQLPAPKEVPAEHISWWRRLFH